MKHEDFWQEILPPGTSAPPGAFPATLPDGRVLLLPIRRLKNGQGGLASLIINQASFAVADALAEVLAARLAPYQPEIVAGLPTLGLTLAAAVAQKLGHARYVPFGTSEKFWYDAALSVPISSVTTPDQTKRLFVDPRMLPLLEGRRIALVDDVISTGRSILAGISLLETCGVSPMVVGTAMLQTERWREKLQNHEVETVLHTPLLP
ncbi:MAG: phosphoribosyltransferase [Proteobacteria bacterium]|nr:phosphoribosyltransferase [Pseudomonadota bacterium]MBU6426303.1 phosphoribosyltransferase [Rhodospirillales bacterium]